jgi:adenosylmethionine-8-amino-7-oxononanoate aminotransferase
MCGMGKTGTMHAWEQEGIRGPDIQMIGKALGGGFVPLSGVLLHEKIFQAISNGSKGLMHGHTFQAHPTACAAAVEAQLIMQREDLLSKVQQRGRFLEQQLHEKLAGHPFVADIRGRGLFWSVELMLHPASRTPFAVDSNFSNKIVDVALDNGLNILGNLGSTGTIHVEHVILCPAYVVEEHELVAMVDLLKLSLEQVSRQYQNGAQQQELRVEPHVQQESARL